MKAKELATKDAKELRALISETRKELGMLTFSKTTKPATNHRKMRTLKKDVARMLTILAQKNKEPKEVK